MRVLGAVVFLTCVASLPTPVRAADAADDLRALTEARFAANAAGDRAFYERLLAPNAVVVLPKHAPQTKREYLDEEFGQRTGPSTGPKATMSDFRAQVDGDTAVVTYKETEPTQVGEQVFEVRTERLDTYVRRDGGWRLLSMAIVEAPSWPDVAAIDGRLLDEYAGTYRVAPAVDVVITNEGGHLMQAMMGQPKGELFPENATTFFDRTDSPLARTVFERDITGRVVAQVYRSMGQKIRADRVRAGKVR
jgi:ketosteroid isomerase-like protein